MPERGRIIPSKDIGIKDKAKSPENCKEIKRFSSKTKEALKNGGYFIYESTGKSIKDLRGDGYVINWHKDEDYLKKLGVNEKIISDIEENDPSVCSEVAINPKRFFLERTYKEKLGERIDPDLRKVIHLTDKEAIDNFSDIEISGQYPGAKAIIGTPATWSEITFKHYKETGEELFAFKGFEEKNQTGTETKSISWKHRYCGWDSGVVIGDQEGKMLRIHQFDGSSGHYPTGTGIAPLIVPEKKVDNNDN